MSNRYLFNKSKKAKKGISPVIATVILVAVAVVIAAAMAGFAGSLFGSYSQNSQVQIRSVELHADGTGALDMVNKGASAETVVKINANNIGDDSAPTVGGLDPVINANGEATVDFALSGPATEGQQVTLTVTTQSGQQYTISTTVLA